MTSYSIVDQFERRMADYAGCKYGVAVESCTAALFLSCVYLKVKKVTFPARTYISAPMAVIHAGGSVEFEDYEWYGIYQLKPYPIWDGAKRMRSGMYQGGFHCLSFHAKKLLPIGRGGMILTNDDRAEQWFRRARFDGRHENTGFVNDNVDMLGWNCYMTPDQAARGLQLLEGFKAEGDMWDLYPDLRKMEIFKSKSSLPALKAS
jgi:dTDP-4-amino-4,6-dideoxygalactose transaminase